MESLVVCFVVRGFESNFFAVTIGGVQDDFAIALRAVCMEPFECLFDFQAAFLEKCVGFF